MNLRKLQQELVELLRHDIPFAICVEVANDFTARSAHKRYMALVCVEGLPGACKGLFSLLASRVARQAPNVKMLEMTISQSDLSDVQSDPERWNFYTQLRILLDSYNIRQSYTQISQANPSIYSKDFLSPQIAGSKVTPVLGLSQEP